MKKSLLIVVSMLLVVSLLVGCGKKPAQDTNNGIVSHDKLIVYFVPSREPAQIIAQTEPLKELLKAALLEEGFDIGEVEIHVGTSYEAVGDALGAGTAHIGFVPGGTYVVYDDSMDVILTATRAGLNKDSENPKDWNDGLPTEGTNEQVTYYRSLLIVGPSAKGQELLAKINNGEQLTFEDLSSANWGVRSSTSSAGYIYPTIWLQDNYGKSITDLANVVQTDSYGSTMARLASGQIDVGVIYADARRDYVERWNTEYGRSESIWAETGVIGVTAGIYNDTISVTNNHQMMTPAFIAALQNTFINIAQTGEGKEVIAIYNHEGYKRATSADYDKEREAQVILRSLKK